MTKSVRDRLLEQAKKFHKWQETTYPGITTAEIGGEWEVDYPDWNDAYEIVCWSRQKNFINGRKLLIPE